MAKKNAANVVGVKTKTTWKQAFKRDWQLYLLLLLPLIMVFVFSYGAYPGHPQARVCSVTEDKYQTQGKR